MKYGERKKQVLDLYNKYEMRQIDIARLCGVSRQRINAIIKRNQDK